MHALDADWAEEVCAICDPVFEAADVGFVRQVLFTDERRTAVQALLWEADPSRFATKYPDSGVVETYGEQWPDAHCIDYWVNVDTDKQQFRLCIEGWNLPELAIDRTGSAAMDGSQLADTFARVLGVPRPRGPE